MKSKNVLKSYPWKMLISHLLFGQSPMIDSHTGMVTVLLSEEPQYAS